MMLKQTIALSMKIVKLHKHLLFWGLLLMYLYAGYIHYLLLYTYKDVGNALQFSTFLIQSGMLFYMLFGYRLAKKSITQKTLSEVVFHKIKMINFTNILFLFLVVSVFVITILLFTLTYYYYVDPEQTYSTETILFYINYYFLPFTLLGLIGYIVGANFLSKLAYALLIIMWVLTSPTNLQFIGALLVNTKLDAAIPWANHMNLGVHASNELYHPFYGFEFFWWKKLSLLCSFVLFAVITTKLRTSWMKKGLIFTLLAGLFLYGMVPYHTNSKEEVEKVPHGYSVPTSDLFRYEIKRMDATINSMDTFHVKADLLIEHKQNNRIAFTLNHRFQVKSIQMERENLSFQQKGDHVILQLPHDLSNLVELSMEYRERESEPHPLSESFIYLPADHSWLPHNVPAMTEFEFNGEERTAAIKPQKEILYKVSYKGSNPSFINLASTDKGTYEGKARGVTLIKGNLMKFSYNGKRIVMPTSWFIHKNEIRAYIDNFEKGLYEYNRIFHTSHVLPDEIVILPSMDENDTYMFSNVTADPYHLLVQLNPSGFARNVYLNSLVPYQIDKAFGDYSFLDLPKDYANWIVFNSLLGHHLNKKMKGTSDSLREDYLYLAQAYLSKDNRKTLQLLMNEKLPLTDEFFKKWKRLLNDSGGNDWQQIQKQLEVQH